MKREPMAGEGEHDVWLGSMLRQWPAAPPDSCVDAETLAAWAEGKLEAKQAAAVELHASNCARCMAMLASLERTTPAPEAPKPSWSWAALLRWLVPLTAAATAIAIWILVPNQPVTQLPSVPVPEATAPQPSTRQESAPPESARQDQSRQVAREPDVQAPAVVPETGKQDQPAQDQFAPVLPVERSGAIERQPSSSARENAERRAEMKEERQALDELRERSLATLRDRAATPPPSPAPPAAPSAPAATANEALAAQTFQQQLAAPPTPSSESTSPNDPLIRWRVIAWTAVERSIDGGNTWIKTTLVPGVTVDSVPMLWVVSVRAVDNLRGTVLTSDRREFYTTNGGISWERVQENSAAPF